MSIVKEQAVGRAYSFANTNKLTAISFLLALGIVLYAFEYFYLPPLPVPGAKLGLANIITLILIAFYGSKESIFNVLARTLVGSLITGTFLSPSFFYSLSGGLLSAVIMILAYRFFYGRLSFVGISVLGAVFHNIGQLVLAFFLLAHLAVFLELPLLILIATFSGTFNGIIANYTVRRVHFLKVLP